MYGETEKELLKNAKEHDMEEQGYTEDTWRKKYPRIERSLKN